MVKYVSIGACRSIGSLCILDPTILPSGKSLTETVVIQGTVPVGLRPVYAAVDESGKILAVCISFTELILFQTEDAHLLNKFQIAIPAKLQ
jgi:hypothetical protein